MNTEEKPLYLSGFWAADSEKFGKHMRGSASAADMIARLKEYAEVYGDALKFYVVRNKFKKEERQPDFKLMGFPKQEKTTAAVQAHDIFDDEDPLA